MWHALAPSPSYHSPQAPGHHVQDKAHELHPPVALMGCWLSQAEPCAAEPGKGIHGCHCSH
jgi:hypothetical protein